MKGIAAKVVSGQWGEYSNYYITLINIPLALSSATSSAMMPEIATRFIKNEYKEANEKINEGIQLTMFLCIPAAVGLAVLAFPITKVLFPSSGTLSGQLLLAGSITVIFSALSTITNGVLQAIGKARIPLRNSAISLVLNVITVAVCSFAAPQMGVFSVLIASLVFAVAMCVLNAMSLKNIWVTRTILSTVTENHWQRQQVWVLWHGSYIMDYIFWCRSVSCVWVFL